MQPDERSKVTPALFVKVAHLIMGKEEDVEQLYNDINFIQVSGNQH